MGQAKNSFVLMMIAAASSLADGQDFRPKSSAPTALKIEAPAERSRRIIRAEEEP